MNLEDINIRSLLVDLHKDDFFFRRLSSQEVDILTDTLYKALAAGAQKILLSDHDDPSQAYKVFAEQISMSLSGIQEDLQIKDLSKKFRVDNFLQQILMSK